MIDTCTPDPNTRVERIRLPVAIIDEYCGHSCLRKSETGCRMYRVKSHERSNPWRPGFRLHHTGTRVSFLPQVSDGSCPAQAGKHLNTSSVALALFIS
jgi:hypothetical protein